MPKSKLLQQYIDEHACRTPAKIAAYDGLNTIDYAALDLTSNQLAHCLRDHGVLRQDRVAICLGRSVLFLTAILGSLKADAIYVPLDRKIPLARWQSMFADCQPSAIICEQGSLDRIIQAGSAVQGLPIIVLDAQHPMPDDHDMRLIGGHDLAGYATNSPTYSNRMADVAYILYTSGSTGQPKGVMVTHQNIRCYIDWAVRCFNLKSSDRILSTAPFNFDMSIFDIFCTLKAGAMLCIADEMAILFPEKLVSFIEQQQVTVWKGVTSLLIYLARSGIVKPERMTSLNLVLFAGEPLPANYLLQWMKAYPKKRFVNAYGPTEATGISLYYPIDHPPVNHMERIPIGKPCAQTEVFLLRNDLSMAGQGEIAELCIAGAGIAKGYFNDPARTGEVFVSRRLDSGTCQRFYRTGDLVRLRDDGNYEFISRKDNQVKIMGYRIELGDIEHALMAINRIDDAAVVTDETGRAGLVELIAYYESSTDLSPAEVIAGLKPLLPHYMLPKRVIKVTSIPRNSRGKLARDQLCTVCPETVNG